MSDVAGKRSLQLKPFKNGKLHPVQQALLIMMLAMRLLHSGMIMNAVGLLNQNPEPSRRIMMVGR